MRPLLLFILKYFMKKPLENGVSVYLHIKIVIYRIYKYQIKKEMLYRLNNTIYSLFEYYIFDLIITTILTV